jgi:hypothetical protein
MDERFNRLAAGDFAAASAWRTAMSSARFPKI